MPIKKRRCYLSVVLALKLISEHTDLCHEFSKGLKCIAAAALLCFLLCCKHTLNSAATKYVFCMGNIITVKSIHLKYTTDSIWMSAYLPLDAYL